VIGCRAEDEKLHQMRRRRRRRREKTNIFSEFVELGGPR
jgi:hypothetical protein